MCAPTLCDCNICLHPGPPSAGPQPQSLDFNPPPSFFLLPYSLEMALNSLSFYLLMLSYIPSL